MRRRSFGSAVSAAPSARGHALRQLLGHLGAERLTRDGEVYDAEAGQPEAKRYAGHRAEIRGLGRHSITSILGLGLVRGAAPRYPDGALLFGVPAQPCR